TTEFYIQNPMKSNFFYNIVYLFYHYHDLFKLMANLVKSKMGH
ncbi:unnamed protein product, partial [marine sediment metagenome]